MSYTKERSMLSAEEAIQVALAVSEKKPGDVFTSEWAINRTCERCGAIDCWSVLNALDILAEKGVIDFVNEHESPRGQDRIYRRSK